MFSNMCVYCVYVMLYTVVGTVFKSIGAIYPEPIVGIAPRVLRFIVDRI